MKRVFLPLIFALILFPLFNIKAAENLKLELSAEKSDFLPGEPVVILVKATNTGDSLLVIPGGLEPEMDALIYEITDPQGKTTPFSPLMVMDTDKRITLNKNESAYGTARLFYGGQGYSFPQPGVYKVMARYKSFRSNSLGLKISEPKNAEESEQARLILDNTEVGLFLMLEGGDELQQAQKAMETLAQKYPQSLLTAYVRYAQAKNLSVPARNFVSKKPRGANLPAAIDILQSVKDADILMYYRLKTVTTLSECLQASDRKEDARKVLEDMQQLLQKQQRLMPYFNTELQAKMQTLQ